jgi:hypothetical protein
MVTTGLSFLFACQRLDLDAFSNGCLHNSFHKATQGENRKSTLLLQRGIEMLYRIREVRIRRQPKFEPMARRPQ